MTKDPRDREEEFISGLAEDTGRDLGAWMALIDAQTFGHRNDMIDWLRQQGLTFAKASRLERIHHNGGKPVYGDRPPGRSPSDNVPAAAPPVVSASRPSTSADSPIRKAPAAPASIAAAADDLAAFLAKAKGYRPLAELLLRRIRSTVPATTVLVQESHAELHCPALFAAIAVTAKDVRLVLDLGETPCEGEIKRLRLPGVAATLTHGIILSDARKIDAVLMDLVASSAMRANS